MLIVPSVHTHRHDALNIHAHQRTLQVAVYTAVTGGFEKTFKEPFNCTGADYFAFTDDSQGTRTQKASSCWRMVPATQHLKPDPRTRGMPLSIETYRTNANIAKYHKLNPHLLKELQPYKYVIWVDGTQWLKQSLASPVFQHILGNTSTLTAFEHCTHNPPSRWERCRHGRVDTEIFQTASVVSVLKRQPGGYAGQYKDADFDAQRSYYAQAGFKDLWFRTDASAPDEARTRPEYGVWVTCLIVMNLMNPDTLRLLDAWWIENANTTMQDQVTLSFAVWRTQVFPHSLPAHGVTGSWFSSSLHKKMPHNKRRLR